MFKEKKIRRKSEHISESRDSTKLRYKGENITPENTLKYVHSP